MLNNYIDFLPLAVVLHHQYHQYHPEIENQVLVHHPSWSVGIVDINPAANLFPHSWIMLHPNRTVDCSIDYRDRWDCILANIDFHLQEPPALCWLGQQVPLSQMGHMVWMYCCVVLMQVLHHRQMCQVCRMCQQVVLPQQMGFVLHHYASVVDFV
jgi:hypothetical protein